MRRRFFLYAAAASIVGILGFLMMQWLTPIDSGAMADNFFVKESYTVRGGESDAIIKNAYDKMKSGNYQGALDDLAKVPDSETVLFLRGESYYFINKFDDAADVYRQLIDSLSVKAKKDKAQWLLALTELKAKGSESTNVKDLINDIADDKNHAFTKEAQKLSESIR